MRRRVFVGSVGAAAAGMAIGLRASRAGGWQSSSLGPHFENARRVGKPLILATIVQALSADTFNEFEAALVAVQNGPERGLAVRLRLVELLIITDSFDIRKLTGDRTRLDQPSLTMVDGERPRLVKEAKLHLGGCKIDLERFLRELVPLSPAWLEPRVALLSQHDPGGVREIRRRISAGEPTASLVRNMPAVVALEAVRRRGEARAKLFEEIVAPHPVLFRPKKRDEAVDCGIALLLVSPLGARFADAFTTPPPDGNGPHGRRRNHAAT